MKIIGIIGGMSWESTASYYKKINEGIKQSLGGLHSAKIVLYSVDFDEIATLQYQGKWDETARMLSRVAQDLETIGADFLIMCTNTMHKVASEIENAISIPLLHIADATAQKLLLNNVRQVGLLGTRFTMEQDFYKKRLSERYGIAVMVPNPSQQTTIHDIIYSELCLGLVKDKSRQAYLAIIDELHQQGAEAVILGCTEITLLLTQQHTAVALYDTTELHVAQAITWATGQSFT